MKNDNLTPYRADEYDVKVTRTIPYYRTFHAEIIDLVDTLMPDVRTWLDTGCGTGTLVESAMEQFPGCRFILSDPSEKMLDRCRARLAKYGDRAVFLGPAGSGDLALDPGYRPDVITAVQAHHYMNRQGRERATRRCHELLRGGGVYITFENIRPETGDGIRYGLDRWMKFQARQGRDNKEVDEHRKRFDSEYFPITIHDHVRLLHDAGFGTAELFWMSYMQAGFYGIK